MTRVPVIIAVGMSAVAIGSAPARAQDTSRPAQEASSLPGLRDFDFQVGEWRVHHRLRRTTDGQWMEFEGTCSNRGLIDDWVNVDYHTLHWPTGVSHGVGLRAYDPKTGLWAMWWLDRRYPFATLDPPVKGRFENGVGTFYSDDMLDGTPIRTRFTWSHITPTSARWEQAHSTDGGKTWDTNWIMEFRRAAS